MKTKMSKKNKIRLAITLIIIILALVTSILVLLYLRTDMFKSNQTLFLKYLGENVYSIKDIQEIFKNQQYEDLIANNKYIENTQVKANYTESYGTTLEDTSNNINNLKLAIEGYSDKSKQYSYKNFKLLKDEVQIANIEYAQNNNVHGVKFPDVSQQYITVEKENIEELFKSIGYEGEINNLLDSFEFIQSGILSEIKFTEEQLQVLREKYLNIINENLSTKNFDKKLKESISINNEEVVTNSYILKLTNEQLNNIYIKLLESFKNEEIILSKIDKLQNLINTINYNSLEIIDIKKDFIDKINNIIEEINTNNIGTEETKIIVYEKKGKTLRTAIQGINYEINFDNIQIGEEKFLEISIKNNGDETKKITINKNNDKVSLNIKNYNNNTSNEFSIEKDIYIDNEECVKNINFKYENEKNRLEINSETNINLIDEEINFKDTESIKLNNLEEEQIKKVLDKLNNGIQQKFDKLKEEIKIEDLKQILVEMGIINETQILQGGSVTEIEKSRFNSKFEILVGENIDNKSMLRIIETIKDNVINLQVVSKDILKIEISRDKNKEELIQILEEFVEKEQKMKYDVELEYDEKGIVKYIILTIKDN